MLRFITSLSVVAGAVIAASGCSTLTPSRMESFEQIQPQLLGDLPMPQDAKIDNEQSLILGAGPEWTGRIVAQATQGPTEIFTFYRDQLPPKGWTGVSSVKAKTSVLVFTKGERTLTVEIADGGTLSSGSRLTLTAGPKGLQGTPPRNPNTANAPQTR
ncbi:hypothetical protein [Hydrogenophaga aquatica]